MERRTFLRAPALPVGVTAGERFLGARVAQRAETVLEHERRGTTWRA
ncbi:hypothetical protein [Saccharothrix sp. Mg75]